MLLDPDSVFFDPDGSINYVWRFAEGECFEAREVRRQDGEELIVYISSQTACSQACRMCHLTQTGQNTERNATLSEMVAQADRVLWEATASGDRPSVIHFNFMARGEPLLNPAVNDVLFEALRGKASAMFPHALSKFKVSTIFPHGTEGAPPPPPRSPWRTPAARPCCRLNWPELGWRSPLVTGVPSGSTGIITFNSHP